METDVKARLIEVSDGVYVEKHVHSIVERVMEYDPNLRIKACHPGLANATDPPYKLVEVCRDGLERVVFPIWDLNESILERIYNADNMKNNVFVDMEGKNLIVRERENQRYKESIDEANDIVVHYLRNPKTRWTVKDTETGNLITLDDTPGTPVKVDRA